MLLGHIRSIFRTSVLGTSVLMLGVLGAGCAGSNMDINNSWVDPTEVSPGHYSNTPLLVPILTELPSGFPEPRPDFTNADEVRAEDLKYTNLDYVIGPGDLLNITLTDVAGIGVESLKQTRVTDTGNVTVPLLPPIHAAGMSESQLQQAIHDEYKKALLLQDATISVTVVEARQRTFQITGPMARTGQYSIVQPNFRVLDALVLAGVSSNPDYHDLYIVRPPPVTPPSAATQTSEGQVNPANVGVPPKAGAIQPSILEPGAAPAPTTGPSGSAPGGAINPAAITPEEGTDMSSDPSKRVFIAGATTTTATPWTAAATGPATQEVFVAAAGPTTQPAGAAASAETKKPFEFHAPLPEDKSRIIRIPLNKLFGGDLRYNVVVRPNDTLVIPATLTGEYYIGGHVQRTGVYSLAARLITLKQAIIAAGMLDQFAIPERTELIRRVDGNQEVFFHVNLSLIFNGTQPDVYLKPYDQIMVGTNIIAPFLAAFRNAYRVTYGFGFVFDQNFD